MGRVHLWNLIGAALIVPCKSGVIYTNQTNGTACNHPECEGIIIPINNARTEAGSASALEIQLCALFDGTWDCLDELKADAIDSVLKNFEVTQGILVNRAQVKVSTESWVHVNALEHSNSCYSGFGNIQGILTWMNSD